MRTANVHRLGGSYRDGRPPEKLVFTWRWEQETGDSGVRSLPSSSTTWGILTEIVLIHELFLEPRGTGEAARPCGPVCLDQLAKIFD